MGVVVCGRAEGEKNGIVEATSAGKQPSSRNFVQFNAAMNNLGPKVGARPCDNRGRGVWGRGLGQIECGEGKTKSQWIFW